ncbi:hypothetical protein Pcinc_028063 [Petrolisthes cinctipes]|uniref:Mediator of RNA polymerase II transcription subunit 29 n=1 Tax=Petrolisthes cinctipes TaxID=88211 RepID=A0AAE1K9F9_PETCI|nr:hypothetical protein Pcinc_028063 [Petrolisthes cinctipes]
MNNPMITSQMAQTQQQQAMMQQRPPQNLQQTQDQQQQHQQQQQQQEFKLDSISRVKNHYGQMKDALMESLSYGATNLTGNNQVDQGNRNAGEVQHARFEESIEKFYTLCDQMELNLRTAIDSQLQAKASQLNTNLISIPPVEVQKYAHYLSTIRNQVVFAKDIHTALVDAAAMTTSVITTMDTSN